MSAWTRTEISQGQFKVTNGDIEITVFSDLSGNITNEAGEFLEFKDLSALIDGAAMLREALLAHYGGYK